jgi:hypothetical protein
MVQTLSAGNLDKRLIGDCSGYVRRSVDAIGADAEEGDVEVQEQFRIQATQAYRGSKYHFLRKMNKFWNFFSEIHLSGFYINLCDRIIHSNFIQTEAISVEVTKKRFVFLQMSESR